MEAVVMSLRAAAVVNRWEAEEQMGLEAEEEPESLVEVVGERSYRLEEGEVM
jgi:hypothetical protein